MRFILFLLLICALCAVFNLYRHDNKQEFDGFVALPQVQMPVLKIDGKESSDVYLQSLEIQVEVTGNIAATRYVMVFKNKTSRILEGELTFPLPDGRSATHYALDINGKMREAVPVEKAMGTQVFEEIERRKVDPGLLERVDGNNLRTRIYPIPANGTRVVSIGYEEELALENGMLHYRLPMAYPSPLEKFAVKASVLESAQKPVSEKWLRFDLAEGGYVASFAGENYQSKRALAFALPAQVDVPQVMMQSAQGSYYFLASVAPKMEMRKRQWKDDLAVIWDVSLSGSQRNLKREIEMLDVLFAEKKNANVNVYFLNNKLSSKGKYEVANGQWDALKNALETAVFDGGTDFSQIDLDSIAGDEILFFSDGISILSDSDFFYNAKTKRPIHCTVSSLKADYSAMKLIADETGGIFFNANISSSEKLKNELLNETMQFIGAEHGENVREVYPSIPAPVYGNFSVAGILDTNAAEIDLLFGFDGVAEKRVKAQLNASNAISNGNVYKIWAQKKIAELDLNYEENQTELAELGKQFGIVTRNTSLIVLETIRDYVQYGIEPPASEPELLAEYRRRTGKTAAFKGKWEGYEKALQRILKNLAGLQTTGKTELSGRRTSAEDGSGAGTEKRGALKLLTARNNNDDLLKTPIARSIVPVDNYLKEWHDTDFPTDKYYIMPTYILPEKKSTGNLINDYMKQLTGKADEDYKIYLKLRKDHAGEQAFYFDMSGWFYALGDKETALRILTSIAELELESAPLYRLLGYRLKEYGEYELEKFVCKKVLQWRPMEPQSLRDYALALADNGEAQAALDSLNSMISTLYQNNIDWRSKGIKEAATMEINHLIAKNPSLDISMIDKSIIANIPVDIRIVMNWNTDNTDIDLLVIDPNNKKSSYKSSQKITGERRNADMKSGYGPEQFMLKKALRGKYKVYAVYYGDGQFKSAAPSTIMAEIYTKYAGGTEQRQVVTLQMSNLKKELGVDMLNTAKVAEFGF